MEIRSGGWRWVHSTGSLHDHHNVPEEPSAATIALWQATLAKVIQNHVGSRPSLGFKVTDCCKQLARESKQVSGKWMLFDRGDKNIKEEQWERVKKAVAGGKLGPVAKMSEGNPPGRVMCVYTHSFEDEKDIRRVLEQLQELGVYPTSWKADLLTYVGLIEKCPRLQSGWFLPHDIIRGPPTNTSSSSATSSSTYSSTSIAGMPTFRSSSDEEEQNTSASLSRSHDKGTFIS